MPKGTSAARVAQIEFYGVNCLYVENPADVYDMATQLAEAAGGHYIDQFTNAALATDWRGNNNIAESIYEPMAEEPYPVPRWIVVGAGTGGTSATIGRYIRYRGFETDLCLVDPTQSVFYHYFTHRESAALEGGKGSGVEGIGRPRVEPSFIPDVIDRMIQVENTASFAAMHFLAEVTGRKYGGSTGTNFYDLFQLAMEIIDAAQEGSIVTLACDPGDRYLTTYYDHDWLRQNGHDIDSDLAQMRSFFRDF